MVPPPLIVEDDDVVLIIVNIDCKTYSKQLLPNIKKIQQQYFFFVNRNLSIASLLIVRVTPSSVLSLITLSLYGKNP